MAKKCFQSIEFKEFKKTVQDKFNAEIFIAILKQPSLSISESITDLVLEASSSEQNTFSMIYIYPKTIEFEIIEEKIIEYLKAEKVVLLILDNIKIRADISDACFCFASTLKFV